MTSWPAAAAGGMTYHAQAQMGTKGAPAESTPCWCACAIVGGASPLGWEQAVFFREMLSGA